MKARKIVLTLILSALTFAFAVPRVAAATNSGFIPVAPQLLSNGGTLSAVKITQISRTATGLVASGLAVVNTSTGTIIAPFTGATLNTAGTTCPILHLVLGPINLDLLGLQVTTNQIVLDITAVPGPGNLVGNLLCDVANLLNQNPLNLNQIAALLTQILASL